MADDVNLSPSTDDSEDRPGARLPTAPRMLGGAFAGPIPPPSLLADYERISPGLADRIVGMAENQSQHRRDIEQKIVAAEIHDRERQSTEARIGQASALIITLFALGVGAYTACAGHEVAGGILGIGGISGIVATFIAGRDRQRDRGDVGVESTGEDRPQRPRPRA